MIGLLAKKVGMTQLFNEHGRAVAATVLEAGPCTVTQVNEPKAQGLQSIQVGFESMDLSKVNKPMQGHFKKAGIGAFRYLREFRMPQGEAYTPGQQLTVELFKEGELVDVTGISIGKGFQGGVKRWHWRGGSETHGSTSHRAPGSIGSTTFPGRVIRGHHLPGHMGDDQVTVQNLRVMKIDPQTHTLVVQGAVPGPENRLVTVKRSVKRPGAIVAAKGLTVEIAELEEDNAKKKPAAKKK